MASKKDTKRPLKDESKGQIEKKMKKNTNTTITLPHPNWFIPSRARCLTSNSEIKNGECVIYWMSRDQRSEDNWALLYARALASEKDVPLRVVFCLVPRFLEATVRHFGFMIRGLAEVESQLHQKNIPFHLLRGWAPEVLPAFAAQSSACAVVTDMSPLRVSMKWATDAATELEKSAIPLIQVDAHNIVPVWVTSSKQEYAARTIRSKIHSHLPDFLTEFPELEPNTKSIKLPSRADWDGVLDSLQVDKTVPEVTWLRPGMTAARGMLLEFCESRLKDFATKRNDPNVHASSDLSPYFHFGQLSVQTAINAIKKYSSKHNASVQAYIEEAVVRRELSDNYCFYNHEHYDDLEGCSQWARETLEVHRNDTREYVYSLQELETSSTHDDLWNAAQKQLVVEGKMHGFLRMYWAKKILEWTVDPETALHHAIYLNDRFSLDGRDPNGYVGVAWSIMGIHDMGWAERKIFGKIRFMNYEGCKRKFNVPQFVAKYGFAVATKTSLNSSGKAKSRGKKGAVPRK